MVLGLGVTSYLQFREIKDLRDTEDQRAAAMQAASRQVVLLTTVDDKTSSTDVDRLLQGATESFRAEFEKDSTAFFATLKEAKVVSKGSVEAVGLTQFDGNKAEVIVAATGTVTNKSTATPEKRVYRLQVKLEQVKGNWLVAGMRFVV